MAGLEEPKAKLVQSVDPAGHRLTGRALQRRVVLAMIKRRAAAAGLPPSTCCHTFRATGITAYLSNGGTLEHAQQIAGHASPETTKLYDRPADTLTVDEIERIVIEWGDAGLGRAPLVDAARGPGHDPEGSIKGVPSRLTGRRVACWRTPATAPQMQRDARHH